MTLRASVMEKRGALRHKCFLRAFVYFEGHGTAVDCIVRDISDSGARLQFGKPLALTELLDLHIPIKGKSFHAKNGGTTATRSALLFTPPREQAPPIPASIGEWIG
jgi:hypothetical protein